MRINIITLLTVLVLACTGCTQNDGHIGKLFGSWALTEMSTDGTVKSFPDGDFTSMSFQAEVVRFIYHRDPMLGRECFGSWKMFDGILQLDFTHSDDNRDPGTSAYEAPTWLDFPANSKINLMITDFSDSRLTLVLNHADGKVTIYKFERTW